MQTPDLIAQILTLGLLLLGIWARKDIKDMEDGNIERLIREDRSRSISAARARVTLLLMQKERVA